MRERDGLAVLGVAGDVLGELNDGASFDVAGFDTVVELGGDHGVLARNAVGDDETEPLLRSYQLDIDQRLQVQVAG